MSPTAFLRTIRLAFAPPLLLLVVILAGCPRNTAQNSPAPPASTSNQPNSPGQPKQDQPKQKIDKEFYSPAQRIVAIQAATIYVPTNVGSHDTLQGPPQNPNQFQFHPDDKVTCDFDKPGSQMGGKTPKFQCSITKVESANGQVQTLTPQMEEEPVKVKYGATDNEIYAEVVSTRLMWALGFYADSWFPVKVTCNNCPANPESNSGAKGTQIYGAATIVRKYDGHKMYEEGKPDQGWSWKEFAASNGRPTYEKDGLMLLGAFMQHSDNKPPQQRLVCDGVKLDTTTKPFTTTCKDSKMIIQDVGATWGSGGLLTSNEGAKMNLDNWSGKKLWNKVGTPAMSEAECPVCQAGLRKSLSATDGLDDPNVSEEGRRFLAGQMCQLTDAQIENLFRVARVAYMPEYHNSDGSFKSGFDENSIVKKWADAFKAKREQLASGRCRWNSKPADLNALDNPAGLATVPNFCTAQVH
jgi:hypothetical protein